MSESLAAMASRLYDQGDFDGLKKLALEVWPDDNSTTPAPGVDEVCRHLFILAVRRKDATASNLWRARAMSAAVLNGTVETIAGLILQPFFVLTAIGSHAEARLVLGELLRVMPESHPRAQLFRGRLYHEKLAYSFAKEGRFEEASKAYREASRYCGEDIRGVLKVRGGAAVAAYLALCATPRGDMETTVAALIAEMTAICDGARQHGFPDVLEVAGLNLDMMKAGESQEWRSFETE